MARTLAAVVGVVGPVAALLMAAVMPGQDGWQGVALSVVIAGMIGCWMVGDGAPLISQSEGDGK